MNIQRLHSFHIPVLGLAYSIDTPVKVARFGISSVISIIDDQLIEDMRNSIAMKPAHTIVRYAKTVRTIAPAE